VHRLLLVLSILCLTGEAVQSQTPLPSPRGSDLEVSLVTVGPGRGWFEWLGHSGILVADFTNGRQRFFEYGVFTPGAESLWRAVTGDMVAGVREQPASIATSAFNAEGRRVSIQKLDLTPAERADILVRLERAVRPGHNLLPYQTLTANCTTAPRDLIDSVTGGALRAAGRSPSLVTVRQSVAVLPISARVKFLMDFTFNNEVDRPITTWDAATLPTKLEDLVGAATVSRPDDSLHPLVSSAWSFGPPTRESKYFNVLTFLLAGITGAGVIVSRVFGRRLTSASKLYASTDIALGLLLGLPGLLLMSGWLFTRHDYMWANANLLVANPILVAAIPLGVSQAKRGKPADLWLARLWTLAMCVAAAGLVLNLTHFTKQDNLRFYCLLLPVMTAQAFVGWRRCSPTTESVSGLGTDSHFQLKGWINE